MELAYFRVYVPVPVDGLGLIALKVCYIVSGAHNHLVISVLICILSNTVIAI